MWFAKFTQAMASSALVCKLLGPFFVACTIYTVATLEEGILLL